MNKTIESLRESLRSRIDADELRLDEYKHKALHEANKKEDALQVLIEETALIKGALSANRTTMELLEMLKEPEQGCIFFVRLSNILKREETFIERFEKDKTRSEFMEWIETCKAEFGEELEQAFIISANIIR